MDFSGEKIRIDQALVSRGLCESRSEAQEIIKNGGVLLSGAVCLKQNQKVSDGDEISVEIKRRFVSRGGEKLLGVLIDIFGDESKIREELTDKTAIDVGSSTGGFTDCLLSFGVKSVDAVDVGTEQLHKKLKENNKISLFENTDIRNFQKTKDYNFLVADLSFISLSSVINTLVKLGTRGKTKYFLLIKPQFEVGKGNTKKGIVKNEDLVKDVLRKIKEEFVAINFNDVKIFPCSIKGGDGNQEYFLYAEL